MTPNVRNFTKLASVWGVGITVMKAFGGGDLLSEYSPAGKALTAVQCLHYALTRPAVAAVMSGARTMEELKASLDYEKASEAEKDYAEVFAKLPQNQLGRALHVLRPLRAVPQRH